VVISEDVGVVKPAPAIFEIALRQLGCASAQAVMVGNSWETDILGARQAGLSAVWLNRFDSHCPDETLAKIIHALEPTESIINILLS